MSQWEEPLCKVHNFLTTWPYILQQYRTILNVNCNWNISRRSGERQSCYSRYLWGPGSHVLSPPLISAQLSLPVLIALCLKHVTLIFSLFALELLWYCENHLTHVQVKVCFGESTFNATGAVLNWREIRGRVDECSSIQRFRQTILRGHTLPQASLPTVTTSIAHPYSGFSFLLWFAFLYVLIPAFLGSSPR